MDEIERAMRYIALHGPPDLQGVVAEIGRLREEMFRPEEVIRRERVQAALDEFNARGDAHIRMTVRPAQKLLFRLLDAGADPSSPEVQSALEDVRAARARG